MTGSVVTPPVAKTFPVNSSDVERGRGRVPDGYPAHSRADPGSASSGRQRTWPSRLP